MKKTDKEKKVVKKNAFGFKEGSNKATISNLFLGNVITLQNAAKTVEKKLDKEESKAVSMVLGMVKRLLKKGHKVEVTITATPKKSANIKSRSKVPAKIDSEKAKKSEEGEESCQEKQEEKT